MKDWVHSVKKSTKGCLVVGKFLPSLSKDEAQGLGIHSESGVMVHSIADNFGRLRDTKGELDFVINDMSLFRIDFSGMPLQALWQGRHISTELGEAIDSEEMGDTLAWTGYFLRPTLGQKQRAQVVQRFFVCP